MDLRKCFLIWMAGLLISVGIGAKITIHICGNDKNGNMTEELTHQIIADMDVIRVRKYHPVREYHPDCDSQSTKLKLLAISFNNETTMRVGGVTISKAKSGTCLLFDAVYLGDNFREIVNSIACDHKIMILENVKKIRIRKAVKDLKNLDDDEDLDGSGGIQQRSGCSSTATIVLGFLFGLALLILILLVVSIHKDIFIRILAKRNRSKQGPFGPGDGDGDGSAAEHPLENLAVGYSAAKDLPSGVSEAGSLPGLDEPENPYAMARDI